MNDKIKAHLMLFFTSLLGALNFTVSKTIMPHFIKPSSIVVSRGMVSILVFSLIHVLFVKEPIKKKDFPRVILAALFGIVINQTFFYAGLNLTTPINASLMMTVTPIIVLLISSFLIREKITMTKAIGVLLGAVGTALLLLNSGRGEVTGLFTGDLLVFINAISWACFLVVVKPLIHEYNPFTILKWIFFLGFFLVLPWGYKDFTETDWQAFTPTAWWALTFVIVFATLCNYYYNAAVLKYVEPSIAGSYIYLQPFLAALIAIVWGADKFSFEKLTYLILILTGVYLVSFRKT